jgi:hypothetical protein
MTKKGKKRLPRFSLDKLGMTLAMTKAGKDKSEGKEIAALLPRPTINRGFEKTLNKLPPVGGQAG